MSATPMELDVDLGPMPTEGEHFLRQGLRGLLQSQELCDVALVSSGGAAFPAHRAVLAASSGQLRARVAKLDCKIQVDGLPALQLDVKHSEAVKALIDCVYGTEAENCDGCYNPSSEEANRDVLALARHFELPALEDRASRWLARNLTTTNLLDRVSTCERFGLKDVKDKILEQLTANTDVLYELVSDPSVQSVPGVLQDLLLRVLQLLGCGPPVSAQATKDQPIQAAA
mmetsp:Transcript_30413/g.37307  ORF Transcript_30413/g.37307 Transcript_30413/m.37307 type:complete len:229 (+) Transcript_30413:27-713(+)